MATTLQPDVTRVLAPLAEHPATTAVITDFDGTLAPIVLDPAGARPLEGAVDAMARLAQRFGVVAVVSGRPAPFLLDRIASGGDATVRPAGPSSIRVVGLYGLEWAGDDGEIIVDPAVERWRPVVGAAADRLRAAAPSDVEVEPKGLAVTVHWRRAPGAADWVIAAVEAEAASTGLRSHPARMSVELRPPIAADKGSAVRALTAGCSAACYLGDDVGDLPAFAALAELASTDGLFTASIAAVDDESPPEVAEAADVVVPGPLGALAVLEWLAGPPPAFR
ncbi:MAG: trehalose-phosphatase [Acidimicrobiales bacterium]